MVNAFILLNVERESINDVAETMTNLKGVSEVYSVSGQYDLIAVIRVKENEELANLVTEQMLKINGIIHSETMLAFKTYSHHDLETMFSIGME